MILFKILIEALCIVGFCLFTSYVILFGKNKTKIKMDYVFTVIFFVLVMMFM